MKLRKIVSIASTGAIALIAVAVLSACSSDSTSGPPAQPAPQEVVQPAVTPAARAAVQQAVATVAPNPPAIAVPTIASPAPSTPINNSGLLTIAVSGVSSPNGLPSSCGSGCAEDMYLSGVTETLFNAVATEQGAITTEPLLALEFSLDPRLTYGDITLREGVQFHDGWGEMTSEDVAFSFNDANLATNPKSKHGQAGDFAATVRSMQPIDTYTVRLNYKNYDSREMLQRFSSFWQTAGIVSKGVFDDLGEFGMRNTIVGVGPFKVDEWNSRGISLEAFEDYWGASEGLGPFVDHVRYVVIGAEPGRIAALETGRAQIIELSVLSHLPLLAKGFKSQEKSLNSYIGGISFAGNYWESVSAQDGTELQRDRDIEKPWIGDPFELGEEYDENTPSMQRSRLVRNALAWSIERDSIVDDLAGGIGFVNHQPYLSINNPSYQEQWNWGTDFDRARDLLAEAGYPDGFEMKLWSPGNDFINQAFDLTISTWEKELNVKVTRSNMSYGGEYRPGLVSRSADVPGFYMCVDENNGAFPYDWPHGLPATSHTIGGFGIGQELPYALNAYNSAAKELDAKAREEFAQEFFTQNRYWANCVGVVEGPIWSIYDPDALEGGDWDQRPNANPNFWTINNIRSVKLAK